MRAHARIPLVLVLLLPGVGAAQTLPCGECYDRVPELEPASAFELLPGGDNPRKPGAVTVPRPSFPSDPFYIGTTISNLRGMNAAQGIRTLTLVDSRRGAMAPFPQLCSGSATGSLTETIGGMEWRVTGCRASANEGGALAQIRIEEARPTGPTPRYVVFARSASGEYRLVEVGDPEPGDPEPGDGQSADAAYDALTELMPAQLDALARRLREGE